MNTTPTVADKILDAACMGVAAAWLLSLWLGAWLLVVLDDPQEEEAAPSLTA